MTGRKWVMVVCATFFVALGTACNKRGKELDGSGMTVLPVPETTDENGWPLYEVRKEGFALALPPGWRHVDMDPATFDAKVKEAVKQSPELESMIGGLRQQLTAGVKFFGFDKETAGTGFATNVNVLRLPQPPGVTLDAIAAASVAQLNALSTVTKPITREHIMTAHGARERLRYQMSMRNPKGQIVFLAITQYLGVHAGDSYVLTLTTLPERDAGNRQSFDVIGQSLRFLN